MKKNIWIIVFLIVILLIILGLYLRNKSNNLYPQNTDISVSSPNKQNEILAIFYSTNGEQAEALFYDNKVELTNKILGTVTLPRTISASGARYANNDESIIFWNKGDNVTIWRNNKIIFEGSTKNNQ